MTILVIDIGSSSVRALLFDRNAHLIPGAIASRSHNFTTDAEGGVTADALHLQKLTEACIDAILTHPAAASIEAAGMAMFVGNVLGVDAYGLPLTPIYTYADTRSRADVELLRVQIDVTAAHQRTGCLLHTAYHPSRLHWLKRTQPERFAAVHQWQDFATYLYHQWFGVELPCSYSVAAWSGLLNRYTLTWDEEWLRLLHLPPEKLPALADTNTFTRGLKSERWSVLRDVPFYLAMGDGLAANMGAGAVSDRTIALTVGTTAALRILAREVPQIPQGLWCYRVSPGHQLLGGATSEGGSIFAWARQTFALPSNLEAELAERLPDSHGLTWLPLLAGERSPGWRGDATGTIHGLRLSTTPIDILHAGLEGVANRLALIADQLTSEALPVLAGGGALDASPAWAQIICNALNRPLHLVNEPEATARGVVVALFQELDSQSLPAAAVLMPQPDAAAALRAARERQVDLYRRLYSST
jgi:gluconokinase